MKKVKKISKRKQIRNIEKQLPKSYRPISGWGYFWRSASSWVSFGLSCGTLLFGIVNFILYTKTKYRVPNKKDKEDEIQEIVTNNTAIAKQPLNQNGVANPGK